MATHPSIVELRRALLTLRQEAARDARQARSGWPGQQTAAELEAERQAVVRHDALLACLTVLDRAGLR